VEKIKEVQKSDFLKIFYRAMCKNAGQTLSCVFLEPTENATNMLIGVTSGGKIMFVVRQIKNARRVPKKRTADYLFSERYFWRALWKTRTAKPLLTVRPKVCASQS
jgi:hypothetical protein